MTTWEERQASQRVVEATKTFFSFGVGGGSCLHVALVCVDSVKQGFRCHPLDRQPSLEDEDTIIFNHHPLSLDVVFFNRILPFPARTPTPSPSPPVSSLFQLSPIKDAANQ